MTTTATRPDEALALDEDQEAPATQPGHLLGGLALGAVTPLLVLLANPPVGWWPLIFVAFVPMVVAQHRTLPRRWSWLAPAIGVGGSYAVYFSPGLADGEVAVVFQLFPVYVGLIAVLVSGRSRAFAERTGYRWIAVSAPLGWIAIDFLRSTGDETLGGTWGFHAYALHDHPALLQPVSVFGIVGLQLLILLSSWAIAGWILRGAAGRRAAGIVAALVGVWFAASPLMLSEAPPTVRVAAVQNGLPNDDEHADQRLERYDSQTRDAAARGARLVVWNEAGLTFDPQLDHTARLQALARDTDAYLVLGYRIDEPGGLTRNATTLLAPDGRFLGVYGKDHPGTFAGDLNDFQGDFPVYDTELGSLATIICYDLDYTDTARIMTRGGARLIATPSSDVPAIAATHYTHLVFRAIENRVSMVKADSRFDSAIIDPWGRVVEKTVDPGGTTQETLVADIPLGSGSSPWVSYGDWIGWLTVIAAAGFASTSAVTRVRGRAKE
ncbi:MAG TPA: nitrilase-related carbon-nitrogen hydrolase [Acidimicrobiales bacterium]